MAPKLDTQTLGLVFQSRPDILDGIQKAADSPSRVTLFNNIANFVYERFTSSATPAADEPASKRRRIDGPVPTNGREPPQQASSPANANISSIDAATNEQVLLEIKDISVVVPQRKKYDLCFTRSFLYARASGSSVPVPGIVYAWQDIEHAFYLPVPEKSQAQYNYVLFPRNSYLPGKTGGKPDTPEPLVFTVPVTPPKPGSISGPSAGAAAAVSDAYGTLLHWALTTSLRAAGNTACTEVVSADSRIFHGAARQPYRPGEKAVHVKAFRGSKDGFLFFLPTGILWGFKKPLLFLPLDRIMAISYTSVLQRTFNIVVELDYAVGNEGKNEEIEFAMLDQEDYGGIDETYVRRHGLADRSMAERRRAKPELVENTKRSGGASGEAVGEGGDGIQQDGDGDGGGGMTELERAQMEAEQNLQDEEDELEEDYDPGSEGESEGEGESSDEEDEDAEGDEDGEGGEEVEEEEDYDEEGEEVGEGDESLDVV